MIKRLTVQNYALIESLDIEFPKGLIVITGETGAGKSILLGALSLLLGGKGDSSVFENNTKNCIIEALFENDGVESILRRVISPSGRSRFFVDDCPVTLQNISELSHRLVDIHAQQKQQLLREKAFQLEVLDAFCSNQTLLSEYQLIYQKVAELRVRLEKKKEELLKLQSDREYMEFQYNKLLEANIELGEIEQLELEEKQLSNGQRIRDSLLAVKQLLDSENNSLIQNIKESEHFLSKMTELVPQTKELSDRLSSCRIELRDILDEVEVVSDKIDLSPERLTFVQERLSLLYSLLKRYSVERDSELIEIREDLKQKLNFSQSGEESVGEIEKSLKREEKKLQQLADTLSEKRTDGGVLFSQKVKEQMYTLGLKSGDFELKIDKQGTLTPSGQDNIKFLFSANPGEKLIEIERIASGGELSRVMLCIKNIIGIKMQMPTMIFDEIDVGVSGQIADKMGVMLGKMGEKMQILAITHLPQIASKGNNHLLVYKEIGKDNRAHTHIRYLSADERVLEIARLLSGESTSKEAVQNAKVLLENH